jgi:hypothetical protein
MLKSSASDYNLNATVKPNFFTKTLPRKNFRGMKKDELQRQTSMYLASMTVSF